jgi:hypothetical protein
MQNAKQGAENKHLSVIHGHSVLRCPVPSEARREANLKKPYTTGSLSAASFSTSLQGSSIPTAQKIKLKLRFKARGFFTNPKLE